MSPSSACTSQTRMFMLQQMESYLVQQQRVQDRCTRNTTADRNWCPDDKHSRPSCFLSSFMERIAIYQRKFQSKYAPRNKGSVTTRWLVGRRPFEFNSFHAAPIGIMLKYKILGGTRPPVPPVAEHLPRNDGNDIYLQV